MYCLIFFCPASAFLRQAAFIPVQKASPRKTVAAAIAALCNVFILMFLRFLPPQAPSRTRRQSAAKRRLPLQYPPRARPYFWKGYRLFSDNPPPIFSVSSLHLLLSCFLYVKIIFFLPCYHVTTQPCRTVTLSSIQNPLFSTMYFAAAFHPCPLTAST